MKIKKPPPPQKLKGVYRGKQGEALFSREMENGPQMEQHY